MFSQPFQPFPAWEDGEDPLEEELHPSPCRGNDIFWGDGICLRTFYGRYVDVEGTHVNARWGDKGDWQYLMLQPASKSASSAVENPERQKVRSGEAVHVR